MLTTADSLATRGLASGFDPLSTRGYVDNGIGAVAADVIYYISARVTAWATPARVTSFALKLRQTVFDLTQR